MIKIDIPRKVPTINHVYGYRGFRKFIKKEGKELREYIVGKIIKLLPIFDNEIVNAHFPLEVKIEVYEDWLTKDGKIKRKDIDNRAKFLLDSVFEGLQLDDKFIYKLVLEKVQSETEKSIVYIDKLR